MEYCSRKLKIKIIIVYFLPVEAAQHIRCMFRPEREFEEFRPEYVIAVGKSHSAGLVQTLLELDVAAALPSKHQQQHKKGFITS